MLAIVVGLWLIDQVVSAFLGLKITFRTLVVDFFVYLVLVWIVGSMISFFS